MEMDLLAPTVSELESRIYSLEMRNVELEIRNVQLTKALSAASIQSGNKIDVVNKFSHLILKKNLDKISAITTLAGTNEENTEVYNMIDKWSRCMCVEDFFYADDALNNGVRNRPCFSLEDYVVLFDAGSGFVDQKQLQRLCRKFADSLSPDRCLMFPLLRGDTRHSDVLSAYLGAVITLHLYVLHHSERPAYLYPMSAKHWTRYSVEAQYSEDVVQPNNYDIPTVYEVDEGAIDLLIQRKKFRRF